MTDNRRFEFQYDDGANVLCVWAARASRFKGKLYVSTCSGKSVYLSVEEVRKLRDTLTAFIEYKEMPCKVGDWVTWGSQQVAYKVKSVTEDSLYFDTDAGSVDLMRGTDFGYVSKEDHRYILWNNFMVVNEQVQRLRCEQIAWSLPHPATPEDERVDIAAAYLRRRG